MNERRHSANGEIRIALFSDDNAYRYRLSIIWNPELDRVQFIGLNPSTADEMKDDPTIRRVKKFCKDWNYGSVIMTNLFAWRATNPIVMKRQTQPVGESGTFVTAFGTEFDNRNDMELFLARQTSRLCIAAWGKHGSHLYRAAKVRQWLKDLRCLRLNTDGSPEHPLYLPADLEPIPLP